MVNYQEARNRFAERLRSIRRSKNITQEQLAGLIAKSTEHISFLERGERSPSFEVLLDLAAALQTPLSDLLNIDEPLHESRLNQREVVPLAATDAASHYSSDMQRLAVAVEGIRAMQDLANDYGIRDILQDNGGKVLQVLILLGLKISPGREGNDAVDAAGNEYELKTLNRSLNRRAGVTTHHHLNPEIINKYRRVAAWYIAFYEGIELIEIYRVEPAILEPLFQKWEQKIHETGKELNNPKIPLRYVLQGERVYP